MSLPCSGGAAPARRTPPNAPAGAPRIVRPAAAAALRFSIAELNADRGAHVLALGVEADPEPRAGELAEVARWVAEHGGVPYLAHPYWSGLRTDGFEACEEIVGIEVYNAGCELEVGRGDSSVHWDEALERKRLLYGIAVDDSHHPGFDSSLAWVWARCAERSQPAVLDALRSGTFYSSSGPAIHSLEVDETGAVVRCSPAASVTILAGRRRGARVNAGRLGYPYGGRILERDGSG